MTELYSQYPFQKDNVLLKKQELLFSDFSDCTWKVQ